MKKKHLVLIVFALTIIVVPSVFAANGNPWREVWNAIFSLDTRVSTLESGSASKNYIRFYDTTEYIVEEGDGQLLCTTFTWIPQHPDNNVILKITGYVEIKGIIGTVHGGEPWPFFSDWQVDLYSGDNPLWIDIIDHADSSDTNFDYKWSPVRMSTSNVGPSVYPNYPEYTIKFRIRAKRGIAFYRNINIILEVVDG